MKKIISFLIVFLVSTNIAFASTNNIPQTIFTDPVTTGNQKSVIFNGHIDTNTGYTGTTVGPNFYFEYGTDINKYTKTNSQSISTGIDGKFSATVAGLKKNTLYYYRFVQETGSTMNQEIIQTGGELRIFYLTKSNKVETLNLCSISKNIRFGSKDSGQVYLLQKFLYEANILSVRPDGNFGPKTLVAWKKYQKDSGIKKISDLNFCGQNHGI